MLTLKCNSDKLEAPKKEIIFPEKTLIDMTWEYSNFTSQFTYTLVIRIKGDDYIQNLVNGIIWYIAELPELKLWISGANNYQIVLKGTSNNYISCEHISYNEQTVS